MFRKTSCPCHGEQITNEYIHNLCVDCYAAHWTGPYTHLYRQPVNTMLGMVGIIERPLCPIHAALMPPEQVSERPAPVLIQNVLVKAEPLPELSVSPLLGDLLKGK